MLGDMLANAIASVLNFVVEGVGSLVTYLLQFTVFAQISLAPGAPLREVLEPIVSASQAAAEGILGVLVVWSVFKQAYAPAVNTERLTNSPGVLIPRALVAMGISYAALDIVSILLDIANGLTAHFIDLIHSGGQQLQGTLLGTGAKIAIPVIAGSVAWTLVQPVLYLLAAAFLLWVVASYFVRLVEIALFTFLLPLGAVVWVLEEGKSFYSVAITELLAVIFYQPVQVMLWYLAERLLFSPGLNLLGGVMSLGMGIMAVYYMTQAPRVVRQFFGQGLAGGATLGGEMAAGYLAGKGIQGAFRASALGQTIRQWSAGYETRQQAQLATTALRPAGGIALANIPQLAGWGLGAMATGLEKTMPGSGLAMGTRGLATWLGGVRAAPVSLYHALGRQFAGGLDTQSRFGGYNDLARAQSEARTGRPALALQARAVRAAGDVEALAGQPEEALDLAGAGMMAADRRREAAKNAVVEFGFGGKDGKPTMETAERESKLRQRIAGYNRVFAEMHRRTP